MTKIITLTSDFGLKDPYAAEMKAAILNISPDAQIVDITHLVDKFNVPAGAFMLAMAAAHFPKGTIHVAVVDPGVGSQRRPIIIQTEHAYFVGPDNGLLMLAAHADHIVQMCHIESRRLMLTHVSNTFHGRDIFAPVAAHLANGVALEEFGPQITDGITPDFAKTTKTADSIIGEVLHVDNFGNIITNIHDRDIFDFKEHWIQVQLPAQTVEMKASRAYSNVKLQEPLVLIGSHSYLEITLNQGNAAEKYAVKAGDKITLTRT